MGLRTSPIAALSLPWLGQWDQDLLEHDPPACTAKGGTGTGLELHAYLASETQARVSMLILPHTEAEAKLLSDVRHFKWALSLEEPSGRVDAVALAARLAAVGHSTTVRTAIGGGSGSGGSPRAAAAAARRGAGAGSNRAAATPCCFKNLRHVFLAVAVPAAPVCVGGEGHGAAEGGQVELLVDAAFKEHFLIPHPTCAYLELLSLLPDEWVGPRSRLLPLVEIICSEMAASFTARGLALPPWRRAAALVSKWAPLRSRDTAVSPAGRTSSGSDGTDSDCSSSCSAAGNLHQLPSPPAAVALRAPATPGPAAGSPGTPSTPTAVPAGALPASSFSRLDDGEMLRSALERRYSGRGLLSDKLLGSSPAAPKRRAVCPVGSSGVGSSGGGWGPAAAGRPQRGRQGGIGAVWGASPPASCAAAAAAGAAVRAQAAQGAAAPPAKEPSAAAERWVRGMAGVLSRHPSLWSGQPATWVVRAAPPPSPAAAGPFTAAPAAAACPAAVAHLQ